MLDKSGYDPRGEEAQAQAVTLESEGLRIHRRRMPISVTKLTPHPFPTSKLTFEALRPLETALPESGFSIRAKIRKFLWRSLYLR